MSVPLPPGYTFVEILGKGSFGVAVLATYKKKKVVIKIQKTSEESYNEIRAMMDLLKTCGEFYPCLIDHGTFGTYTYITTKYLVGAMNFNKARKTASPKKLEGYFRQLVDIVSRLHQLKYAHLDIKPDNIVVSKGKLYLIDFGSACKRSPCLKLFTKYCVAPDLKNVSSFPERKSSDIWAIAATLVDGSGKLAEIYNSIEKGKEAPIFPQKTPYLDLVYKLFAKSRVRSRIFKELQKK